MADPLVSHRDDQFWENVEFLRSNGLTNVQISERLGIKHETFLSKLARKAEKEGSC